MEKTEIDKKYIVDIKGKKFVTFNGLLAEAHKQGIVDTRVTELNVDWEKKSAYCIVACKIGEKEFMGVGSGTQENCGDMVKGHFVEMAHTRAKSRAYRDALNIDMVSVEELTDLKGQTEEPKKETKTVRTNEELRCKGNECFKIVDEKVYDYSNKNYGKTLCFECQKNAKAV